MLTTLHTRLKRASRWLPALLLPFAAQAQAPGYSLGNTANVAGTFTSIATTGTAITTANTDDANSGATPIGFTFNYNGTAFTQFVLNTNGFIRLGAAAPSSAALFYTAPQAATAGPIASTDPADVNLIMPFAVDLTAGSVAGTGYQVATTGVAGSRVTTIQWTNVQDKASTIATQFLNFSFQAKLYENGQIEFVYGPTVANTVGNNFHTVAVGIKGNSAAASTTITKGSTQAWSAATFAAGDYTGNTHNIRQAATADAGRTYRFGPNLANDAAVAGLFTLGKVSSVYSSPVTAQVVVANPGNAAQTNLVVTFTVTGATPYSTTQTVASLASGASTTLTFSYPVTGTTGTNVVTASIPNTDDLATNNSKTYSQDVTAASLSFIDSSQPLFTAGVGVGQADGVLAARYTLTQAATVSSVSATFVGAGNANTTYQVQLYNAGGTGGTPGTVLYTSPTQTRPGASGTVVIPVPSISVPAGDFFVAIKELDNNVVLAYQLEDPLRPATFYFQVPGSPFALVNTTALRTRLALEVGLSAPSPCGTVTALAVGSITATGASISFTAPASGTSYTVTYTPAGGTATTVTPAPTASPVVLTGLTPGTAYTVRVITNCAAGLTSGPATATFTTPVAPPAFAPLPYVQDFETTWLSVGGTRDAPAANWRNSPTTGDNSFRRDDDGASANWRFLLDDNDPTLNVYNTRFSTGARSARFHSYGSAAGLQGRLDMYVNMSAVGTKTLSFDYINSTGADKLDVFVSTDGGTTFSATPILTATVNTTFTAKTVAINSTSATTVIRFQATSDFGNNDLGFDNVQLRVISATQNAALAATVGLYPNPAHQSFQLSVPAGNLRTASATLSNALGQVVQTRALSATGTTTFDVSSLAAGVYSLTLKSGNDLVVKRVVVE
ncbi:T9SS type A sorting domain-containing protein [Hymenobacter antarcticus]|uniref:Fibronectin type-III domain-containing protein n=1 Tax=Hymenobacter antarcticus TaxID=486270 RepID=A0ABP7QQA3_9BACT